MRKGSSLKTAFLATALSVVGVLAGCAHPQLVSMGETQQEVIAYLGGTACQDADARRNNASDL